MNEEEGALEGAYSGVSEGNVVVEEGLVGDYVVVVVVEKRVQEMIEHGVAEDIVVVMKRRLTRTPP